MGGGSFNAAPLLEPGRYRDTLLPGEYLYYACPWSRASGCTFAPRSLEDDDED